MSSSNNGFREIQTISFFEPRDFDADEVQPGVYVGSVDAADNCEELKKRKISHIVTVSGEYPPKFPNDFEYVVVRVEDFSGQNLLSTFEYCIEFIRNAKKNDGNVLIHCAAGVSRSVTITIAYLMKEHSMTFMDAWSHVKQRRAWACPNGGFQEQLRLFERAGCKFNSHLMESSRPKPEVQRWTKGQKTVVEY